MRILDSVWSLTLAAYAFAAPPGQAPLKPEPVDSDGGSDVGLVKKRPLHGRFLHITGRKQSNPMTLLNR